MGVPLESWGDNTTVELLCALGRHVLASLSEMGAKGREHCYDVHMLVALANSPPQRQCYPFLRALQWAIEEAVAHWWTKSHQEVFRLLTHGNVPILGNVLADA